MRAKSYDVYLYGEDGFTLWALTEKITEVIKILDIKDEIESIFYRPSFGRGGGRSCFGEFDAILSTKTTVYLIESKWMSETSKSVHLLPRQVIRHYILQTIINQETICTGAFSNFNCPFVKNKDEALKEIKGTRLNNNLETICHIAKNDGNKKVRNILLIFREKKFNNRQATVIICGKCSKNIQCQIKSIVDFTVKKWPITTEAMKGNFISWKQGE